MRNLFTKNTIYFGLGSGFMIQLAKDTDLETVLDDIENGRVWLLEDGGCFVGTVTIKENAVNRLFVLPEFQSHGFGSKLMDFAEVKITEDYSQIHIDSFLAAKEMKCT